MLEVCGKMVEVFFGAHVDVFYVFWADLCADPQLLAVQAGVSGLDS